MKYSIILYTILIAKEIIHAGLPQSPCHFKAYYLSYVIDLSPHITLTDWWIEKIQSSDIPIADRKFIE